MDAQTLGGGLGGVFGLLIAAIVGLIVGVIAKVLMPGKDPGGWFMTILLGIAGSWVGGFLMSLIGMTGTLPSLIGAIIGAMILLAIFRVVKTMNNQ